MPVASLAHNVRTPLCHWWISKDGSIRKTYICVMIIVLQMMDLLYQVRESGIFREKYISNLVSILDGEHVKYHWKKVGDEIYYKSIFQ
jgi:hypothetical protein